MKKYLKIALLTLLVLTLLSSCRFKPMVVMFNNTDQDIIVSQGTREVEISAGVSEAFMYPGITPNEVFEVAYGDQKWQYSNFIYPPEKYCMPKGKERIKMQIEPNGWIYVLLSTTDFLLGDLSKQPEGFPLKPNK